MKSQDLDNKTQELELISLDLNNIINENINELKKSKELQEKYVSQNIILEEKIYNISNEKICITFDVDRLKNDLCELKSTYDLKENEYMVYRNKIESDKIDKNVSIINNNDLLLEMSSLNTEMNLKVSMFICV
jgi:hypothetical protein